MSSHESTYGLVSAIRADSPSSPRGDSDTAVKRLESFPLDVCFPVWQQPPFEGTSIGLPFLSFCIPPSVECIRYYVHDLFSCKSSMTKLPPFSQIAPLHPVRREIVELRRRSTKHSDAAEHLWDKPFTLVCEGPPTHASHQETEERRGPYRVGSIRYLLSSVRVSE